MRSALKSPEPENATSYDKEDLKLRAEFRLLVNRLSKKKLLWVIQVGPNSRRVLKCRRQKPKRKSEKAK